jgi:hypothetical protein
MTDSRRAGFRGHAIAAGAWLLGCAELVVASPAGAVAAPYVSLSVDPTIPVGGVVTGYVQCLPACMASKPSFMANGGTPLPGRFAESATGATGTFVFIPESPLQAGTYSASVSGPLNTATAPFTVVETAFELPKFTSTVVAETVPEGTLIECQERDASAPVSRFTEKTRVRPVVTVSFSGPYVKQYRYALALPSETPSPSMGMLVQRRFDVEGDELCFDVLGFSYQNDSVTQLGQDCVSLVGLGVGVKAEIYGDVQLTLLGCVVPPAGYETNWCAAFGPAFASKSCEGFNLDACFAARRGCPSGDQPSSQQEQAERDARANTGAGGGSGTGGGVGSSGTGALTGGANGQGAVSPIGAQDGSKQNANPRGDAEGCSLGRGPSGGTTSWLVVCAALLFLSRRRAQGAAGGSLSHGFSRSKAAGVLSKAWRQ